jgi:hypothetical protein
MPLLGRLSQEASLWQQKYFFWDLPLSWNWCQRSAIKTRRSVPGVYDWYRDNLRTWIS